MNKNALLALSLVVILPLASYLFVKGFSDAAVVIPARFYADSVITNVSDGKETTDTVWHKVQNITLTNQLGNQVSLNDLNGKVIIADFFFTKCPSVCPSLTRNIRKLQDALKIKNDIGVEDPHFVQFLSFSVDPDRDSATALKKYADRYGVNPDLWWLLTGPKKAVYDFALGELKMGVSDPEGADTSFIHTTKLVLLDKNRVVRGYYDGLDSAAINKLASDLVLIMMEKDKKKKRSFFTN